MIRTCPQCAAFYGDQTFAFCVTDGTPLVGVDPGTEKWEQAKRYFDQTTETRKRIERKTRRRRVLVTTVSVLVVAMVVSVVTVNALIVLDLLPKEPPAAAPPATVAVAKPEPTPDIQWPAPGNGTPASSPTPLTSPTASPTATPTPPDTPVLTGTPPKTPELPVTPTPPACSAVDRDREKAAISARYAEKWSSAGKANPPAAAPGVETEMTLTGAEYSISVLEGCAVASVNATFIWQIRQTYNGTTKISTSTKQSFYHCGKNGGTWVCL